MLHHADGADCRRAGLVHLAGPVPGGVTAFPAFPAHERSCPPGRQPIEKIMARLEVSVVALEQSGKAHSRMLCEQRLQFFVQKREIGIWDYRLLDEEPIPDCLRYLVLKAAGGPCQLCGIAARNVHSMSNHSIPHSRGGKTELANLQALCSKCNRSKRNQDDTDFRSFPPPFADPTCVFCQSTIISNAVEKNGSVFAIQDKYPVTPGHLLVIPIRHPQDFLPHLIPRRKGDMTDARGGDRGVIPERRVF
jgi:hypothetical protein